MQRTYTHPWFLDNFGKLDPLLQSLHVSGGKLVGPMQIEYGRGVAGVLGKWIGNKAGIPTDAGTHSLHIEILHCDDGMHWNRCFDSQCVFRSVFIPVGTQSDGYWLEKSGPHQLRLTVDIIDGGWYWRCHRVTVGGVSVPAWLLPRTMAYKKIEGHAYRFHVGLYFPIFGKILSYSGLLQRI